MNNLILNNIHVQFFKSIGSATIEIPELAVFVGKNAAGKSNIVSVFRFLKDLADKGFQTAIQQQGGIDILFNTFASNIENIVIKLQFEKPYPSYFSLRPDVDDQTFNLIDEEIRNSVEDGTFNNRNWEDYPTIVSGLAFSIEHSIHIQRLNTGFSISESVIIDSVLHASLINASHFKIIHKFDNITKDNWRGEKIIVSKTKDGFISYSISPPIYEPTIPVPTFIKPPKLMQFRVNTLVDNRSLIDIESYWGTELQQFYSSIGIFDFIPKSIKSAVHTAGNATLDEDGGNINIILQHILQDEEKRHSFMNLVRYVLPFIKDVEIDIPRNGLAMPVIREAYSERFRLPAEFFSDGTATVIAIIVALFFEENSVVVIEEPERYVHPAIMDKLATLFEDAARTKKVVVTTHSPELIRHLKPEHVQLVSRDSNHFTQIRRVTDDEEIKSFLESDMQLDDLLLNNFFED